MNRDVTVQDVMDREYVGVSESDGLVETVELLLRNDVDAAVVQRGSEHIGVLTHEDVLALLVEGPDPAEAAVSDAMTESVPSVSPGVDIAVAADRMSTQESGRLVVTNGTEPLGIVSERDLLATHTMDTATENTEEAQVLVGRESDTEPETADDTNGGFQDQSICEGCGTFASDLTVFNGQLLCSDCRAI
ncbi:CBS domain-containing protein [Halovenus rubra]|uniref:CBS domain-containing protein n=2 Tax=Halovenus rubra TaxID=869890 RepID=A0ABD5X2P0_9EURY|nr:CBS domain-containing protein [Halovenus rubra]